MSTLSRDAISMLLRRWATQSETAFQPGEASALQSCAQDLRRALAESEPDAETLAGAGWFNAGVWEYEETDWYEPELSPCDERADKCSAPWGEYEVWLRPIDHMR